MANEPGTTSPMKSGEMHELGANVIVSHGPDSRTMQLMEALSGITTDFLSRTVTPENATETKLRAMSIFDLLEAAKAQNALIERLLQTLSNYRYQAAAADPYFNPSLRRLAQESLKIEQETLYRIDEVLASRAK